VALFLVAYELSADADYSELRAKLTAAPHWWHHIGSTWLIVDDRSAREVCAALQESVYEGDKLLVVEITDQAMRWRGLPAEATEWLLASP
jgi:hypothetical protein